MHVCRVCLRLFAFVYVFVSAFACVCLRLSTFVCMCLRFRLCVCLCLSTFVCRCLRFRLCVCFCLSTFVCMCLRLLAFAYPPFSCPPPCASDEQILSPGHPELPEMFIFGSSPKMAETNRKTVVSACGSLREAFSSPGIGEGVCRSAIQETRMKRKLLLSNHAVFYSRNHFSFFVCFCFVALAVYIFLQHSVCPPWGLVPLKPPLL